MRVPFARRQVDQVSPAAVSPVHKIHGLVSSCFAASVTLAILTWMAGCSEETPPAADAIPHKATTDKDEVERIALERDKLDKTVWSDEIRAQKHEDPFVQLWDALRAASDKYQVLSKLRFDSLILGKPGGRSSLEHGIEVIDFDSPGRTLNPRQWRDWLVELKQSGFRLVQSEWHHSRFDSSGAAPRSTVSMTLHVTNRMTNDRYIVHGDLQIGWASDRDETETPAPVTVDASGLKILRRQGAPFFDEKVTFKTERGLQHTVLIAHDLDGDGLSELILPATNTVLLNKGNFTFEQQRLLKKPPRSPAFTALLAELTGDAFDDLLVATYDELLLYAGQGGTQFPQNPLLIECVDGELSYPAVITAGDIDADGDLDVWLGQYRLPYQSGQLPTPYYDANDGYPAFLLRNDGEGHFEDVTESAGLQDKRFRRTYSASLVDLDDDRDLDLVVVSDFSGVDIYQNDGTGQFADATKDLVDERHAFGMALTFGDYDLDSNLDFLMIGMSSTTARRLDRLGLGRDEFPEHQSMRPAMGYGNRMYLARDGVFRQASFNDLVARTGWSWGTTSCDFDNDGDRDIYVANGHFSGRSAKDYCTRFWCHDIYVDGTKPNPALARLMKQTQVPSMSWNGYEHNVLLWNLNGAEFVNIGFLADVAFEFDSRNVVGDDLDGDGRIDLLVVEKSRSSQQMVVRVLRNEIATKGNWIGLKLGHLPGTGIGTSVRVITPEMVYRDVVVAGDSFTSQHATTIHIGLGETKQVDAIEIAWPGGKGIRILNPEINRYHKIESETATSIPR